MLNEDRPLHESHLSDEVRGYLLGVLDASRLRGSGRLDVMLELIAHFEDGLAAGRSAEELQKEFGDGKLDFQAVWDSLQTINYDGPVSVELSRHSHAAPKVAERAIQFLRYL